MHEAPINAHLERAYVRAAEAAGQDIALDVLHSYQNDYSHIGRGGRTGLRIRYSGMSSLKSFMEGIGYDSFIFIDLPYKDEDLVPYAWLALREKTPEKFFVANDILLPRGSIFGMDLAEDIRLLKGFSAVYILNQHSARKWGRFGLPKGRIFERDLAVDCVYYDGKGSTEGNYVFTCGQAARNYDVLFEAAERLPRPLKFKIYTSHSLNVPKCLTDRVEIVSHTHDSSRMKELIAGAKMVMLPIGTDNGNPGAGLTVALISMAMKKVVLTRGTPCIHRYLKNGVNAFTYNKLGVAELLSAAGRILALSAEKKKAIGVAARQTVLERNNIDSFAERFITDHCC